MAELMSGIGPLSPLQDILKEKERMLRQKDVELAELQEMCKQFMQENEQLKSSVYDKNAELNNMESKMLNIVDKNKNTSVPRTEYDEVVRESAARKVEVQGLQDENKNKSEKLTKLQKVMDELERTNEGLDGELEKYKVESTDLKVVVNALEKSHKSMLEEVNDLREKYRAASREASKYEEQLKSLPKSAWGKDNNVIMDIFLSRLSKLNDEIAEHIHVKKEAVTIGATVENTEIEGAVEDKPDIGSLLGNKTVLESAFDILEANLKKVVQQYIESLATIEVQKQQADEINRLQSNLAEKDGQIEMVMSDLDKQKMEWNGEIQALNEKITAMELYSTSQNSLVDDLKSHIKEQNLELDRASTKSVQFMTDAANTSEELNISRAEVDRLMHENETLKDTIQHYENNLENSDGKLEKLRENIATHTREITSLQEENHLLKKQLVDAKKKHAKDAEERRVVTANVDRLNREIRRLFAEMADDLTKSGRGKEVELKQQCVQLSTENGKLKTEIDIYKTETEALRVQAATQETSVTRLKEETKHLNTKTATDSEKLSKISQENQDLVRTKDELERKLNSSQNKLELVQKSLSETQAASQKLGYDLQQRHHDVHLLLSNRTALMQEIQRLNGQVQILNVQNNESVKLMGETDRSNQARKTELEQLRSSEETHKKDSVKCRNEILQLMDKNEALTARNKALKRAQKDMQERCSMLGSDLSAAHNKGIMRDRDIMNLQSAVETLKMAADSTTRKYDKVLLSKQRELDACKENVNKLEDTIEKQKREITELKNTPTETGVEPYRERLASYDTTQSSARTRVTNFDTILANAHQSLLKENRKLKQDIAYKQIVEVNLSSQIQNTQAKYDAAISELNVAKRRMRVQEGWMDELFKTPDYQIIRKDDMRAVSGSAIPGAFSTNSSGLVPLPKILTDLESPRGRSKARNRKLSHARSMPLLPSPGRGYKDIHKQHGNEGAMK